MYVYMINFPDNSIYVGATKNCVKSRVKNHISKYRSKKYMHRKIYQKMEEFGENIEYKVLKNCSNIDEMYDFEKSYIALFKSKTLLNNSTGGKHSSAGKSVPRSTVLKMLESKNINVFKFEVLCFKTKKSLYIGYSPSECQKLTGINFKTISYQLYQIRKGITKDQKFANRRKYLVRPLQEVSYSNS